MVQQVFIDKKGAEHVIRVDGSTKQFHDAFRGIGLMGMDGVHIKSSDVNAEISRIIPNAVEREVLERAIKARITRDVDDHDRCFNLPGITNERTRRIVNWVALGMRGRVDETTSDSLRHLFEEYPRIRERQEEIRFEGLSWQQPRTTLDFLTAFIQAGFKRPNYTGLLDPKEKQEYAENRENARNAWIDAIATKKPDPQKVIEIKTRKYLVQSQKAQTNVAGDVFLSRALSDEDALRRWNQDDRDGRISFSLNLPKAGEFLDFMMTELTTGSLAEIPLKLKIEDISPGDQGNGQNAHLYFRPGDEENVYKAFTQRVYPYLEINEHISLGGRFLMIPVKDESGKVLKGVEFGQSLLSRRDLSHLMEREQLIHRSLAGGIATSGVISMIEQHTLSTNIQTPERREILTQISRERGRQGLFAEKDFQQLQDDLTTFFIGIGRNSEYPILDRDAKELFPHFTRSIQ